VTASDQSVGEEGGGVIGLTEIEVELSTGGDDLDEHCGYKTSLSQSDLKDFELRRPQGMDDQLLLLDFGFSLDHWFLFIVGVLLFDDDIALIPLVTRLDDLTHLSRRG